MWRGCQQNGPTKVREGRAAFARTCGSVLSLLALPAASQVHPPSLLSSPTFVPLLSAYRYASGAKGRGESGAKGRCDNGAKGRGDSGPDRATSTIGSSAAAIAPTCLATSLPACMVALDFRKLDGRER